MKHVATGLLTTLLLLGFSSSALAQLDPLLEQSIALYLGTAGTVDDPRAKRLLEQAQPRQDALSIMWLARVLSTGRMGFAADKPLAQAIANSVIGPVEYRAKNGDAEAQFLMGTAFAEGLGKPVDDAAALRWYYRAAAQGHVLARHNIGNVYAAGRGTARNPEEAMYWWTLAAEAGDVIPMLRLGEVYEQYSGAGADIGLAVHWYREAARRGNSDAINALTRLGFAR